VPSPYAIRTFGDPVLRRKCEPVDVIDDTLKQLAADMITTMYDAPGVGLAAPQIGVSKRFFVFDADDGKGPFTVINPRITRAEGEYTFDEGCLSVPGLHFPITRANEVDLTGTDLDGNEINFSFTGFEAKIMQHEFDHLDGILLLQRLDDDARKKAMRTLRERQLRANG
jgi:peptide deformylase